MGRALPPCPCPFLRSPAAAGPEQPQQQPEALGSHSRAPQPAGAQPRDPRAITAPAAHRALRLHHSQTAPDLLQGSKHHIRAEESQGHRSDVATPHRIAAPGHPTPAARSVFFPATQERDFCQVD